MARNKGIKDNVYTDEQLAWLQTNRPLLEISALAGQFNTLFKASVSPKALSALCKRKGFKAGSNGCFKKQAVPWNKGLAGMRVSEATEFKPGNRPIAWN
jgi:hypothetical protein